MKLTAFLIAAVLSVAAYAAGNLFTVSNQQVASVTVTSTKFLNANSKRAYLLIQNNGTQNVIVKFGSAQSATEGVIIPAMGNYEPYKVPTDSVYLLSASGTQSVQIVEGI